MRSACHVGPWHPTSHLWRWRHTISIYGPDAGTTASEEAIAKWTPLLFPAALVSRIKMLASGKRVIFFQAQLRYLAAEVVRLDQYGDEDLPPVPDAGKEGTHVTVPYTGEGSDKTAVGIDDFGKDTMKVSKGAISRVDTAAHTVSVKTEDGSEESYHVAKDATVDTEHGVVKGTEYTAKKGEKVSVHYTEEAGKKIAHFIKHL